MIIYGSTLSPFVRKVAAFALEKQVSFELKPRGLQDPDPEFKAASPFGKMPAMVDGDYSLADSSAICHYIDAAFEGPKLIPADPKARGKVVWFDEFADTILFGCGQKLFFNRVVAPRFLNRPGDEAIAQTALREELPPILDYLEGVVPGEGGYLVGNSLTLADIAVASPFANFIHLDVQLDGGRHPRLKEYVARILNRPSFKPMVEKEITFMERTAA